MTQYVVDASVAAKWFFPENDSQAALELLSGRHTLLAPDLIRAELGNMFWKLVMRKKITPNEATLMMQHFLSAPLCIQDSALLLPGALEIAMKTRCTVYDSLYFALAMQEKAKVVTADKRLANTLEKTTLSRFVMLLGEG